MQFQKRGQKLLQCFKMRPRILKNGLSSIIFFIVAGVLQGTPNNDQNNTSTTLLHFGSEYGMPLYALKERISDPLKREKFFAENLILKDDQKNARNFLEKRAKKSYSPKYQIYLDYLPKLLDDAKALIKSFLLLDDAELEVLKNKEKYIRKEGVRRLFTYAKIQQVIKDKNLSHIRLPRKVLVLYNRKTKQYVLHEEALRIIDDIFKGYVFDLEKTYVAVGQYPFFGQDFDLFIFAEKQPRFKIKLNNTAYEELKELLKEAPFDVGYDNIFTDQKGDAIIIDTEFKGEASEPSIVKLERYRKQ